MEFSFKEPMGSKLTELADLAPSRDYALNSFLVELNDDLSDEDLKKLKFLCKGKYGIGKAKLEKVEIPIDLFDILKEKELLTDMNTVTLQAMLWTLPRRDLQQKYVDFVESQLSSIYFIVPKDKPENGYKYLKFHIRGADLDNYQRPELEKLRWMIANILRVPPEFVIVSGIEPSSSLIVTIMVLEEDAERILTLSANSLAVLAEMYVDALEVDDNKYPIAGGEVKPVLQYNPATKIVEEETRKALIRSDQIEKELEKANAKISELQIKLKSVKSVSPSICHLFVSNERKTFIL